MFHIATSMTCTLLLMVCLTSCQRASPTPDVGSSSRYEPLPETDMWDIEGEALVEEMAKGAKRYYERKKKHLLEVLPDRLVLVGNCESALQMLEGPGGFDAKNPVTINAMYGYGGDRKPYLNIDAINTNRETDRIRLIARGPDHTLVYITYRLAIDRKHFEFSFAWGTPVQFVSWNELLSSAHTLSDGKREVVSSEPALMPLPDESGVVICVAIQDRSGRLSNFTDLQRIDFRLPENRAPEDKNPE